MLHSRRLPSLLALLLLPTMLAGGCQAAEFDDSGTSEEADASTGTGEGEDDSDPTGNETGDTQPTYNCDPDADEPCPDGQKCTVLDPNEAPVYECVTDDAALLPYESCTPAPGTGLDGCPTNHACLGATPDATSGLCVPLCKSDSGCDAALCVAPPGFQVPFCAAICDPLAPLCPGQQDCQRVRKSNFVCQYPLEDDVGTTAEACNGALDHGCAEGFVCETGGIIPGCSSASCCTPLCDLAEPDPCAAPMLCGELPLDPQPGLENVGACYVPQ